MTNLDNIRKMNSEELAEILNGSSCKTCIYKGKCQASCEEYCTNGIKAWLEQEVTPVLTDDEKVILRNLSEKYKNEYIKRDEYNGLCLINKSNESYNVTCNFNMYGMLFDFIESGDCYKISKLLGE